MEVINALARNTIDFRRAELILRALHIAVKNARRVRFNTNERDMVREVPNYPAPPKPAHSEPEPSIELNVPPQTPLQLWATLALEPAPDPTNRKPPPEPDSPPSLRKPRPKSKPQKAVTEN